MKQIRLILAIVLGAVFSLSANATPIFTEQFQDYATGSLGNAGTGAENWLDRRQISYCRYQWQRQS